MIDYVIFIATEASDGGSSECMMHPEVPEVSRVRVELSSWPDVLPGLVMSWTL